MDPDVLRGLLGLDYGQNVELPHATLHVPEEFQRQLKPRNWGTFVPALFGRATVMEVDGEEWLCDGLHRVAEGEAKEMWATQDVPCIRFPNGTKELAAAIFHLGNSQRISVPAADQFRAACVSGDAAMLALDADLLEVGLDGWCQGRADADLGSIGTVIGLVAKEYGGNGREHALYTLDTIGSIWSWMPGDERFVGSPNIRIIKGFGEYLRPEKRVLGRRRPRRWDRDETEVLVEYIHANFGGENGHEHFILKAQARRAGGGGGGSAVGMEEQIHDCFLKAKREQRDVAA